jgi:transcriptional regulator with XRE-family HTH domain
MVEPMASVPADLRDHVACEVRNRRQAAGLSIAEVARRADVSAPFISQLEAGRTSMSIPTLYRVAAALGCRPNALLGGETKPHTHLTRAGEGVRLPASDSAHSQQPRLLSRTGDDVLLQAYHYAIHPDDDEQEWFEHAGEDVVYVVRGSIVIEFADRESVVLGPGDALHHDGTMPHRWVLHGDEPAEVVIVVGDPTSASRR